MTDTTTEHLLDALAPQIHDRLRGREGRLSWLRLTSPPDHCDEVAAEIDALLARMGIDFVDVQVDPEEGTPRIVEARFDQGWA